MAGDFSQSKQARENSSDAIFQADLMEKTIWQEANVSGQQSVKPHEDLEAYVLCRNL